MSSQFLGLNIGLSGLNVANTSLNTTSNNIANVNTPGYSRQKANITTNVPIQVHNSYGCVGTGSKIENIERIRDEYYDEKYRTNESNLENYSTKQYYSELIEDIFDDSGSGFSNLYDEFVLSIEDIIDNTSTDSKLSFISNLEKLTDYFKNTEESLISLQKSIDNEIKSSITHVNSVLQEIGNINKQINVLEAQNGNIENLLDKRDLLLDDLSSYFNIETSQTKSNLISTFRVTTNGINLVNGKDFIDLETKENTFTEVYENDNHLTFSNGKLKALFDLRDGLNQGIPHYLEKLNKWKNEFSDILNQTFENGYSSINTEGIKILNEDFSVNSKLKENPDLLATKLDKTSGVSDCSNLLLLKEKLNENNSKNLLEEILVDSSTNTSNSTTKSIIYKNMKETIKNNRLSISGVDTDEEAANLIKFQNMYALNSKVIQTFSEIYDRLILYTGV